MATTPWTDLLRLWRDSRGWTQQELADRAGYKTKGGISQLESGEREYTKESLERLAEAFGVEPWQLLLRPEQAEALKAFEERRQLAIEALGGERSQA
jgi:transcriptional regulator with XRE-family HTH domain